MASAQIVIQRFMFWHSTESSLEYAKALLDRGSCPSRVAIENKRVEMVGLFLKTLSDGVTESDNNPEVFLSP